MTAEFRPDASQPELVWVDAGVPETRADVCQVQSSRTETVLLFGTRQPPSPGAGPRAALARRVVLSPVLAKELARTLANAVRDLESRRDGENATPAGLLESAASDDDAPVAARPLLGLVRGLGVGFGFEKSFKMGAGGLRDDRLILGVRTRLVEPASLLGVCRALGMPADFLAQFESALPGANTVGFGFEGDDQGGVHKAYLEFWERLSGRVRREPRNVAPELLFLGFKWAPRDPARRAIARYTCHPLLSVEGIERRLAALYEGRTDSPSQQAARAILGLAARTLGRGTFVYVEAAEEGNPRQSFDLNLYKAGLRVGELKGALHDLARTYRIAPGVLDALLEKSGGRTFGHLSGGLGRDGRDFLTVYYELEGL